MKTPILLPSLMMMLLTGPLFAKGEAAKNTQRKGDIAKETALIDSIKAFFPSGAYRKISGGDECPEGQLDWNEQALHFGSGTSPMIFHSLGGESQTPQAKDGCSAKTKTTVSEKTSNKQKSLRITEKITQQNCGAVKVRTIDHDLYGVQHHGKIEVTVTTKDSTRLKDVTCKYERSSP